MDKGGEGPVGLGTMMGSWALGLLPGELPKIESGKDKKSFLLKMLSLVPPCVFSGCTSSTRVKSTCVQGSVLLCSLFETDLLGISSFCRGGTVVNVSAPILGNMIAPTFVFSTVLSVVCVLPPVMLALSLSNTSLEFLLAGPSDIVLLPSAGALNQALNWLSPSLILLFPLHFFVSCTIQPQEKHI